MSGNIRNKLSKQSLFALFWLLLSLLLLSGATFAWFTFSSYTNVTPMTGSIGNGGADLKISNSESGPFDKETELIVNGTTENLQPVSTSNQKEWFTAVSHNSNGISTRFTDVTETINERSMYGTVYLLSEGGPCDVYFNTENLYFGGDSQLLSACRLGMTITTQENSNEYIFNLGSYVKDSAIESILTTETEDVVIERIDSEGAPIYLNDPSVIPALYSTTAETAASNGANALCHILENEIVKIDWRLYMEGCDESCINLSQNKEISMNLAFQGIGTN